MAPRPPFPPPEHPLQKHLRRIQEAMAEGQKRHGERMRMWEQREKESRERWSSARAQGWEAWAEKHAAGVEKWAQEQLKEVEQKWAEKANTHHHQRLEKRLRRKELKQMQRQEQRARARALKRQRQMKEANPVMGWVFAVTALVLTGAAFVSKEWWLIFVAFGIACGSAGILGRVWERERARLGQGSAEALPEQASAEASPVSRQAESAPKTEDPRTARVNTLCDKLLAELRTGPAVLRDVVHQPEQTVEGLRKSCHELARREAELRSLNSPEDERRLEQDRKGLAARVESEQDAVVKERLEKALRLVDDQRKQRAELATSAARLEAEHMRLYYTLEHLYTQVLRVRSADVASADVASASLRQSVDQLGQEMDAVAEALEEVHGDAPPRQRVR
ncbi:hypothetical protein POL68_25840 [Stigmatella sp. ncwal1]|uniref:Uncharacterized protein n=1 Tax=Stigmatella ashevillensis TaxID=2995309 RepID=A0ABT5DHS7_9BACT|nr:hypothetical protein [Stigmatella ashevillena]MDC0711916.1 hypothetical protein [Stigmatella ashevillena]